MRRTLVALLAVLFVPLCATPSRAAANVVAVYPFAVSGTAPDGMGSAVSNRIADQLAATGGLTVVRPDAKPADYRATAQAAGADYYFSGSIVTMFNRYTALENLVSTRSGTVVWSSSMQFAAVTDIVGEGTRVRNALFPSGNAPGAPAGAAPAPQRPSPPIFAVVALGGAAFDADRIAANKAIVGALTQRQLSAVAYQPSTPVDPAKQGPDVCAATNARELISGNLNASHGQFGAAGQQVRLTLRTYDCRTHAMDAKTINAESDGQSDPDPIGTVVGDAVEQVRAPAP